MKKIAVVVFSAVMASGMAFADSKPAEPNTLTTGQAAGVAAGSVAIGSTIAASASSVAAVGALAVAMSNNGNTSTSTSTVTGTTAR